MRSLATVSLSEILPANLVADPFVAALIPAWDSEFRLLVADTVEIRIFSDLATQPEEVLDQLAWQFNVDFYEQDMTPAAKLAMIEEAIYWHSIKGTPAALARVVELVFGTGTVSEWFDYAGVPFHFRIEVEGGVFPSSAKYDTLMRMVRAVKRAAAIFEKLMVGQEEDMDLYFGGAMQIETHITVGAT